METLGLGVLLSENSPGSQKGERNQMAAPPTGRKRFSDITNIASNRRSERSKLNEQENPNVAPTKSAKDYIAMLLKENNALSRLVDERNKIIEMTGNELQKLKNSLQKANQQNWQLAQANSHMLAELNLGKDRLKAMQHELGCKDALVKAKTMELQEEKKLNRQFKKLQEKTGTEVHTKERSCLKPNEVVADPSHPPSCKKPPSINRKRTLMRSQSLGPVARTRPETAKEKDEGRRKSLRGTCNTRIEPCEPTENLFEIEDLKLPIRSREDGCWSPAVNAANDVARDELRRERSFPRSQHQVSRRLSSGRPTRRAAENVNYKEVPINVKMRRAE